MAGAEEPSIRCVGAVIHDPRGRLLLVRRANEPGKGRWSLPGGRVEPGESDTEAVIREVHEETGLTVTVSHLIGRVERPGITGKYAIFDYACQVTHGDLRPGDDASAVHWVDSVIFDTMERSGALTEGLADTLRAWGCLPRS